ncbi:MAG: hypothetical protein KatS3mg051_1925 [Anaerolineae bacterium]|nr:MAG: hypothetical protein KatS3mg051_1925 [Anaerolineae bacterium]
MNTIRIINLTPHPLNIERADGEILTVPPSGTVARCAEQREELGRYADLDEIIEAMRAHAPLAAWRVWW